jgi:hypothetical protein
MSDTGITGEIVQFLERFTAAMGIRATAVVEQRTEGPRINLDGDEVEILVRHRGEPLKALQHVVDMAFGRRLPDDQRVFVDALDYRRGKDVELKQTAKLLAEKVKLTPRRKSKADRRRSADRSAQSLRTPSRTSRRRRSGGRFERERRRRVFEDGLPLLEEVTTTATTATKPQRW